MNAQHDFRQSKTNRRIIAYNTILTCQRKLKTTAQTVAIDHRHGREVEALYPVKNLMCIADKLARLIFGVDLGKFADIGAGNKTVLFA